MLYYPSNLLHGEQVYLTAQNRDDINLYHKWFSNTEFLRLLSSRVAMPRTKEKREKWFDKVALEENTYHFGIRAHNDDHLLGNCDIEVESQASRHGWVGVYIGEPDDWGKGYGTDAMQVLLRFGFMELNLHRISLSVFSYNPRAIKSYENVGFTHEGKKREALYRDGTYHDIHFMGILQREWMAKHHPQVK